MSDKLKYQYIPDVVSPPGATLLDILEERGITQAELAARTGRPRKTINEIIKGKSAISPETAIQLETVLGVSAAFWNNRESAYRAFLARRAEDVRLKEQVGWVREVPYASMSRLGWVPPASKPIERVRALLAFYAVATRDDWKRVALNPQVSYRRSSTLSADSTALSAWLRQGEIESARISCRPYDRDAFRTVLADARSLTTDPPEKFVPILTSKFPSCGVAITFVPELPGLGVWGATRWTSPTRALIQLSLRYKSDDHLWFTLFHEAGHILLHGKREVFVESQGAESREEDEANRFAADHLIPAEAFRQFREQAPFGSTKIKSFASMLGIAPGIVVGRLQHERLITFRDFNQLKRRFVW